MKKLWKIQIPQLKKWYFLPFLFLTFCLHSTIFAHAHIFIDYKVHACVDKNGLQGVYINWTFDRMFTAFIQKEFDKDNDGTLSKAEQKKIFSTAFKSLKKNNYFTVLEIDGKPQKTPEPEQFSARFIKEKEVVAYTFFLPINLPKSKKEKDVTIYFFDPVIYIAFTIVKKDISIQNKATNIEASIALKRVKYANRPTICFKER